MVALSNTTTNSQTIFAKNSDRSADECQPLVQRERVRHEPNSVVECQFVRLPQVKETYRHVGSRPYWCWGYEHGFNEHQVVIGNEGLRSKFEFTEPKLIGMEILRLGLERGRTAAEAVEVMTDLISRYGQGQFKGNLGAGNYDNGYIVADPHEAYVIETAGHHGAVKHVEGAIGISNVYSVTTDWTRLSPEAENDAIKQGWWKLEQGRLNFAEAFMHDWYRSDAAKSDRRRIRSCAVLKQHAGKIDASTMMALLSDHSDGQPPDEPFQTDIKPGHKICIHHNEDGGGGNTAASLVADLCADGSRLPVYWCSFYSPCLGVFLPTFIEGTLPPVLAMGEATPSDESPWWLFHRLSRVVRAEPTTRIPAVRKQWAQLQSRLFETAYSVAREGLRLIDSGQADAASRLLTDYVDENVRVMLRIVRQMLSAFDEKETLPSHRNRQA